jgi:hypothetical protein
MPTTNRPKARSNPYFKLLIRIVTGVLVASLIGMAALAFLGHQPATDLEKELSSLCRMGFQMTLGAIIGLLGGKAGGDSD